jgi:hypothetical protein
MTVMRARPVVPHSWPEAESGLSVVEVVRAVLGVVVGYVIFAGANILFFAVSGRGLAAVIGVLYSALAGYTCVAVAGRAARGSMIALAVAIALGTAILLLVRPGEGAIWSELAAICVFTPAALLGGTARARQMRSVAPGDHDRP